ncbi:MAG: hypothetical protein ABII09_10840 [Planctomycetota bacterium]
MDNEEKIVNQQKQTPAAPFGHEGHCFVVMPYGRTPSEIRWFRGWYDVVVKPAIISSGYEPKLSSAEEQPSAINDEIRAHLAFDPMVIVDLGGISTDADPNPNVMYELGIRHALGLPLVMMAWKGQRLPFDVGNQRVIMESRELLDLETNRSKLVAFIKAAAAGNYYRPMDAVGRTASIDVASATLGEDSLLGALVREVRDLRGAVAAASFHKPQKPFRPSILNVKRLIRGTVFRKELYPHFIQSGGTPQQWTQLLKAQLPPEIIEKTVNWDVQQWKDFIGDQARQWRDFNEQTRSQGLLPTTEKENPVDSSIPSDQVKDIDISKPTASEKNEKE